MPSEASHGTAMRAHASRATEAVDAVRAQIPCWTVARVRPRPVLSLCRRHRMSQVIPLRQLLVRHGATVTIDDPPAAVAALKSAVHAKVGVPPDAQVLAFAGKVLDDARSVGSYGVVNGATVHLRLRGRGGGSSGGGSSGGGSSGGGSCGGGSCGGGSSGGGSSGDVGAGDLRDSINAARKAGEQCMAKTEAGAKSELVASVESIMEKCDKVEDALEAYKDKVLSVVENDGFVAAFELVKVVLPKTGELADSAVADIVLRITGGLGDLFELAPPPLNVALVPLGTMMGAVVGQVRLVTRNEKAAKQLAERIVEAARTIAEMLDHVQDQGSATGSSIKEDVEGLTELLKKEALPFLERFHDRSYLGKMWNAKPDRINFESIDQGIVDALDRMDKAIGRNTFVKVSNVYDMVEIVLEKVEDLQAQGQETHAAVQRVEAKMVEVSTLVHTSARTQTCTLHCNTR